MSFTGVLSAIGKDFAKGLKWAVQYAVPAEKLVGLLFPSTEPAIAMLTEATTLIQNSVVLVEQKYAAAGLQNGTGAAKLDEVMTLAGDVVGSLLGKAGIVADPTYVQSIVTAVVAILNVQPAPAATTTEK